MSKYVPLLFPASLALVVVIMVALNLPAPSAASAGTAPHYGNRVGLGDATSPPSRLRLLRPHRSVTYAHGRDGFNCRRSYFTDVSAYTWRGYALRSPQRWTDHYTVTYWRGHGGRVTFDGVTFRNRTTRAVLVAGWCR